MSRARATGPVWGDRNCPTLLTLFLAFGAAVVNVYAATEFETVAGGNLNTAESYGAVGGGESNSAGL